jgi:multicomponent Na+:H+ antiporter subunit E
MPKRPVAPPKEFWPRAAIFAGLWWILAQGRLDSFWVGVPVILGAAAASLYLAPPGLAPGLRPGPFARLVLHFVSRSLRGGVDVALRALDPRVPLAPALLEYPLRLPSGAARVLLVNAVSLMPGTLSATLREDVLCVHVLDRRQPVEAELRSLEARVAEAFGLSADLRPSPEAQTTE